MKKIFIFIVSIIKILIAAKIVWWLVLQGFEPESHPISEIQGYLVFLIFDTWIITSSQNLNLDKKD